MMLVMSFHHRHQRYILAMSFSGWFWLVVFLSRPKIPPSRKPLFSSHAGRVLAPCFSGAGLASGSSTTEVGVLWKWAQLWPLNEVVVGNCWIRVVGEKTLVKRVPVFVLRTHPFWFSDSCGEDWSCFKCHHFIIFAGFVKSFYRFLDTWFFIL